MKASDVKVMLAAYRLLAQRLHALGMDYPLHLGVTEAGGGLSARVKSAIGIATLLADGLGDTIRVSLTEDSVHELPVARALWQPRPDLKTAAAAWFLAGGAHHTSFSYDITSEHLQDFAEMAGIEMLLVDEHTRLPEFKKELRWNDLYYFFSRVTP